MKLIINIFGKKTAILALLILSQQLSEKAFAQVANPIAYSTGATINFVRTWEARVAQTDDTKLITTSQVDSFNMTTQYFDGLGRLTQTVSRQASPGRVDMVVPNVYDTLGRQQFKYLLFPANATGGNTSLTDGQFKLNPFQEDSAFNKGQFPGETYTYSQEAYELSPLERIKKQYAPGNSWALTSGNKPREEQYMTNTASDSVRVWTVASAAGSVPSTPKLYGAGELYKLVHIDESGHQIEEYKDMGSRVVLKRIQQVVSPGTAHIGWLNTYYVFDSLNNLRCVIQPHGVELLLSNSWNLGALSGSIFYEQCFRYEYDRRNRIVIRKTPGAGEEWSVYDARDRLVMTQDSVLRTQNLWLYTAYDSLNRPVLTGQWTSSNNRTFHQGLADTSILYPSPGSGFQVLTKNYYDDYSWDAGAISGLGSDIDSSTFASSTYFVTGYNTSPSYSQRMSRSLQTRGLVTGTQALVLGTTSTYLYSKTFFDDRNRPLQKQGTNVSTGKDTLSIQYDFVGDILRTRIQHKDSTVQNHDVLTKTDYDQTGRPKHIWKNIDNKSSDQLIDSIGYNELGQPREKYLGTTSAGAIMDSLLYDYNIRGWLTGINKNYIAGTTTHYFGAELAYDKTTSVSTATYAAAQVNGTIAGTIWKGAGDGIGRKYDFTYDVSNRLSAANFTQNSSGNTWDSSTINYTANNLSYDANGNILSMNQKGFKVGGSDYIDQLSYTYQANSNKLSQVMDAANDTASKLGDFHYKGTRGGFYAYNGNGDLTLDSNKNIGGIVYNYLNLPQQVNFPGKGTVIFTYDALGNKLRKLTMDSVAGKKTLTTYINGLVYQRTSTLSGTGVDTLQFISHEEGRARWAFHKYISGSTAYGWEYDFFEKDHLGNTREILTTEIDTTKYLASMEAAFRSTETQLFNNIASTCVARTSASGYPADLTYTNPNDSVSKVDYTGSSGNLSGPSLLLKVMSGDKVDVGVQYYFNAGSGSTNNSSFTNVLASLANGIATATGFEHGTPSQLSNPSGPLYTALSSFLTTKDTVPTGKPKAYLNWILLDDQFKYVSSFPQSGAIPVANAGTSGGVLQSPLAHTGIPITKNGFLYIWVSNETQNWDVWFDNLSVNMYSGPLLEESHYYPFGLTMAGLSDQAIKTQYAENKYRFNKGSELQNKEFADGTGLEMYSTNLRNLDPQLGRWWQIDPKPLEMISPYSSMANNPILYNDPVGDTTWVYNQNGIILGVVPDHLKNQIHYVQTSGDPEQQFTTEGMTQKQKDKLGEGIRKQSFAFIGTKTVADMKSISAESVKARKEIAFIGTVGSDKEIRLSAFPVDKLSTIRSVPIEKQINEQYPTAEQQSQLFLFGHVHISNYLGGWTSPNPQSAFGSPSEPDRNGKDQGDFGNFLYRNNQALQKGPSPALLLTPWGVTIYGSVYKWANITYLQYKSLK